MERNRITTRIMIIAFLVFLGLCYLIWAPNTMEDFDGYDAEPMSKTEADSFLQSIQTKLSEGKVIKISEYDLNRFLVSSFKLEQSLTVKPWVVPSGIYADLSKDQVKLCLDRNINNSIHHQSKISIELRTEMEESENIKRRQIVLDYKSGQIGKLKLPRAFTPGFNGWYNTFSTQAIDQIRLLKLNKCSYYVTDGELTISPFNFNSN